MRRRAERVRRLGGSGRIGGERFQHQPIFNPEGKKEKGKKHLREGIEDNNNT